jgi:MFS family permease
MLVRTWGWSIPEAGTAYGLVTVVTGPIGVLTGGWLADWLYRRGYPDAMMRVCLATCALLFVPSAIAFPLMPDPATMIALLGVANLAGALMTATGVAALMMITPNEVRGQVTAAYYFAVNALGMLLGPTGVALITDYVYADDAAVRYSMAWLAVVAGVVGIASLVANLRLYRAGVQEAERAAAR